MCPLDWTSHDFLPPFFGGEDFPKMCPRVIQGWATSKGCACVRSCRFRLLFNMALHAEIGGAVLSIPWQVPYSAPKAARPGAAVARDSTWDYRVMEIYRVLQNHLAAKHKEAAL